VTHETVLSVTYATPDHARRVERAIAPEIGDIDDDRSSTRLARDAAELSLTVEAADLVALRAAINTWLSLISVAEDVGEV
jgi:KEOPS complex subunit Pcc1